MRTNDYLEAAKTRFLDLGVEINEHDNAERVLATVGPQRFAAYEKRLRRASDSLGRQNARSTLRFKEILAVMNWDFELRKALLTGLSHLELWLRALITVELDSRSNQAHLEPNWFHGNFTKKVSIRTGKTEYEVWLEKLDEKHRRLSTIRHQSSTSIRSNLEFSKAIELTDFGMLTTLIRGLRYESKVNFLTILNAPSVHHMDNWLSVMNYARNLSAHHEILWTRNLVVNPDPGGLPKTAFSLHPKNGSFRVAAVLAILAHLLSRSHILHPEVEPLGKVVSTYPVKIRGVLPSQLGLQRI